MCCLYGILDYKQILTNRQKNHLLQKLSIACEERGTDATGIAYNRNGRMEIHKKPLPAHRFRKSIPEDVNVVMGHTRLTTQGNEELNYNNHPFKGYCQDTQFALAHNGVLQNELLLQKKFDLPPTKIETDSYAAVQIIEKEGTFDLKAIQMMAEAVEGSFCFTLLDQGDNLYLVKGNNPLRVYHCKSLGFYIYASTEEILQAGLKKAGFKKYAYTEVPIVQGDILILKANGEIIRETFDTRRLAMCEPFWYGWGRPYSNACCSATLPAAGEKDICYGSYLESLVEYAENVGVSEEEVLYLYENGFEEEEIEYLLYSPDILREYIDEMVEQGYV